MRLPGVAVVDEAKVRDYLLSDSHPIGRFKAAFFLALTRLRPGEASPPTSAATPRTTMPVSPRPTSTARSTRFLVGFGGHAARAPSSWRCGSCFPARTSRARYGVPGSKVMRFKELQTVVLDRDLPEHGLRKGDLGAVVQVYEPDGLEVEFVSASGRTEALVTLKERDVRAVAESDIVAVRRLNRSA